MARLLRQRRWCACINNVHGAKKKGVLKNTKFKTGFGLIVPGGTDFCRFNFSVEQKKKNVYVWNFTLLCFPSYQDYSYRSNRKAGALFYYLKERVFAHLKF
jgi:hypothetical protein